jgi:hypothetical protein
VGRLTVADLACGRTGDKGRTLDLTLVAGDREAYERVAAVVSAERVAAIFDVPRCDRYEVPGLLALKYVVPEALDSGPTASTHAGLHWQKTAIAPLLALAVPD